MARVRFPARVGIQNRLGSSRDSSVSIVTRLPLYYHTGLRAS